jgi:RNA polymerase sigma-70 factor (ECF subfamily)
MKGKKTDLAITANAYHHTQERINEELLQIQAAMENPARFAPLYDKYYLSIFRYLYRRINDEDLAADLTSQVFAKALVNLKNYQFRGVPFGAWLFRVAQNELNQHFRKKKAQRHVNADTEQLAHIIDEMSDADDGSNMEKLVHALRELKPNELQLIEMRFFEQQSFREVADILGISENNAKVKTFRVVKKLRKMLC